MTQENEKVPEQEDPHAASRAQSWGSTIWTAGMALITGFIGAAAGQAEGWGAVGWWIAMLVGVYIIAAGHRYQALLSFLRGECHQLRLMQPSEEEE